MPYDFIILNHGEGYDPGSHQFVAPVRGLYEISVSIGPILHAMAILVVNGYNLVVSCEHAVGTYAYGGDGIRVMIQLEAFDRVWVEVWNGWLHSGSSQDGNYLGIPRNMFSGFLYAEW